jgi:putative hydrolase of the HAD superfamily
MRSPSVSPGAATPAVGYRRDAVRHRAVIFDLGGVVLDSPLHVIAGYERERGLPAGAINRLVVETGAGGAWSRLERGEVEMAAFERAFEAECAAAGICVGAEELMVRIGQCRPRPAMIEAIRRIRGRALRVAALTNNWSAQEDRSAELREEFDVFVESSVLGLRKPDPRIYLHTCEALGVRPPEAIFLDDIGRNLKAARALGMTTLKVDRPEAALDALAELLGFELR